MKLKKEEKIFLIDKHTNKYLKKHPNIGTQDAKEYAHLHLQSFLLLVNQKIKNV